MEEPRSRDVDIMGWGVGGGGVRVELWFGVVPRDRTSEESVSLGMGHRPGKWVQTGLNNEALVVMEGEASHMPGPVSGHVRHCPGGS